MVTRKIGKIGFLIPEKLNPFLNPKDFYPKLNAYLSKKDYFYGLIWIMVMNYLDHYTKKFDGFLYSLTFAPNKFYSNGTLFGTFRFVNNSKIDIGVHFLEID